MLPDDFQWRQNTSATGPDAPSHLVCGQRKGVGLVSRRLDGQWYAIADRHRPPSMWKIADCADKAQGVEWLEKWAVREQDRLREEPEALLRPAYYAEPEED